MNITNKEFYLGKIRDYANYCHQERYPGGPQLRKYTNEPYIVHPERVVKIVSRYNDSLETQAAAYLHDVLEDTTVTEQELIEFLTQLIDESTARKIVNIVIELTDKFTSVAYPDMNRNARKAAETARQSEFSKECHDIKCADVIDNIIDVLDHDIHFGSMMIKEVQPLIKVITKADPRLYSETRKIIAEKAKIAEQVEEIHQHVKQYRIAKNSKNFDVNYWIEILSLAIKDTISRGFSINTWLLLFDKSKYCEIHEMIKTKFVVEQ